MSRRLALLDKAADELEHGNPSTGRGEARKCVFKLPAHDPFAITVMGFGVAIVVVIALAF